MFLGKSSLEIVKDEFSAVGKFCILVGNASLVAELPWLRLGDSIGVCRSGVHPIVVFICTRTEG